MQNTRPLSADWTNVLARVEQALMRAVTQLTEREQLLAQAASIAAPPPLLDFAEFEKRMAAFGGCPRPAEQPLTELDGALRQGEEDLRQWLGRAEAARRKLAAWVGRAVG